MSKSSYFVCLKSMEQAKDESLGHIKLLIRYTLPASSAIEMTLSRAVCALPVNVVSQLIFSSQCVQTLYDLGGYSIAKTVSIKKIKKTLKSIPVHRTFGFLYLKFL